MGLSLSQLSLWDLQSGDLFAGSFSFPSVPPNSHLNYEVELLEWEAGGQERPRDQMT